MTRLACFKAYDVRGRVPEELDEELAYKIGRAYAAFLNPGRVALGRDVRTSSLPLAAALAAGLTESGVEVLDLDLCGTEQVYFYAAHLKLDHGIMVTASHNPPEYNGLKFVREGSRPLSGDSGLREIEALAADGSFTPPVRTPGSMKPTEACEAYLAHLLSYVDLPSLKPLKVVVNAGNGCAGPGIGSAGAAPSPPFPQGPP